MRTTLTLDDDVGEFLREQARLHDKPFKQVVNETLRRGMSPTASEKPRRRYRVNPIHGELAPGFDPLKVKEFLDDLDMEHFFEVQRRSSHSNP
ncbi:MAG: DUF2191 domain-containing protein [Chloroflexi bacterium]|nr:DUF2191 domain-containing protein [Chloroflexota bacterium]